MEVEQEGFRNPVTQVAANGLKRVMKSYCCAVDFATLAAVLLKQSHFVGLPVTCQHTRNCFLEIKLLLRDS